MPPSRESEVTGGEEGGDDAEKAWLFLSSKTASVGLMSGDIVPGFGEPEEDKELRGPLDGVLFSAMTSSCCCSFAKVVSMQMDPCMIAPPIVFDRIAAVMADVVPWNDFERVQLCRGGGEREVLVGCVIAGPLEGLRVAVMGRAVVVATGDAGPTSMLPRAAGTSDFDRLPRCLDFNLLEPEPDLVREELAAENDCAGYEACVLLAGAP